MDKKVSIIVPVYNVENYLERCLNSLIEQTYPEIEIILVDDGSRDRSGVMCDEYKAKDNRIKVIHKENGGLSSARNTGMQNASGEFLLFVDSDDYLDCQAVEILMGKAIQYTADIVEGNTYLLDSLDEKKSYVSNNIKTDYVYNGREYAIERINNHCFYAAVWLKLYRKKYLEDINARFEIGRLHEDELWNPQVVIPAERIVYVDYKFYYYDISRPSSIMNNFAEKNIIATMTNCYDLANAYDKMQIDDKFKNVLLDYLVKQYMMVALRCGDNLLFYKKNRKLSFVIKNAKSLTIFFVAILYSVNLKLFVHIMERLTK